MKKFKKLYIIVIFAFLVLPFNILAEDDSTITKDDNIIQTEDEYGELVTDPKTKDVYYYKDGEKLTGFQTTKEGQTYFFGLKSGKMLTGWQELDGKKFYLFPEIREGLQTIDKNQYYIKDKVVQKGFQVVDDGKTYYFGQTSGKMLTGWQELNGKKFYLFPEIREGLQTIDKNQYYIKDKVIQKGFQVLDDGKTYYFGKTSGKMLTGWQELDGKKFYLFPEVREGIQEIDGDNYFIDNNYIKYGFQKNSDGKTYYFGKTSGKMLTGWQELNGNRFYLFPEIREGLQEIEGNKYYIKNNVIQKGFQTLGDGYTYFFGQTSGKMLTGWQMVKNNLFYLDEAGHLRTEDGWFNLNGKDYYMKGNYAYLGIKTIDGITYYFHPTQGYKETGWFDLNGNTFYANPNTGELAHYWEDIDGKRYYFGNTTYKLQKGLINVCENDSNTCDNSKRHTYLMGRTTGQLLFGKQTYNGNYYYLNNTTGILEKIQYVPVYYSQQDYRWTDTIFGLGNMKKTGCAPTAVAMALSSIKEMTILPTDVASYLYWNTQEFNRLVAGASGLGVQYAANNWGVSVRGLSSQDEIINALRAGKIVFANVGPGKFTKPNLTHAIVLYDYSDGNTIALDPYKTDNNGWVSVNLVFQQQSRDPYDLRGGFAFYALG